MRKVLLVLSAVLMLLVLTWLLSCAKSPTGKVIYSGALAGDYASADEIIGYYAQTKRCMGITADVDPPVLVVYEGESVMCAGKVKKGCYTPGTVHLPQNTTSRIIKHEFIHHFLWVTTGELDPKHKSEWFGRCGGIEILHE